MAGVSAGCRAGPRQGAAWRLTRGCWLSGASCGDRFHWRWCPSVVCGHRSTASSAARPGSDVQPRERQVRGLLSSPRWPCGLSTSRRPRKKRNPRSSWAGSCVCLCVQARVCVHPRAHRHRLGREDSWSQGQSSQTTALKLRSPEGVPARPGQGRLAEGLLLRTSLSCHLETTASGGGASSWAGCPQRPGYARVRPSGSFSVQGPRGPQPGELVSILVGSLASGNGKMKSPLMVLLSLSDPLGTQEKILIRCLFSLLFTRSCFLFKRISECFFLSSGRVTGWAPN